MCIRDRLYSPVAIGLVLAAASAVGMIVLDAVVLASGRDRQFGGMRDAQPAAAGSLLLAVLLMGAMAAGRFWLERTFGLATLP